MAVESNVFVKITSEFNGKALDKGKKQLTDFEKLTQKVGKTLGAAFAVKKIINFGQSSVKAFIDSEKAGKSLNQTLNNLGMAYKSPAVDMYLNKLSLQVGIVDEQLKPAYNSLLIATHDTAMAQSLLNTALDVSAGTGKDLESVVAALSKGYLGNTTALQRLGVGLSKAELKSSNFADIIKILNNTFQGQAKYAAQGYTGDVAKLTVAFDQLKESVGKGILEGISTNGVDKTTESLIALGNALGKVIGEVSKFTVYTANIFNIKDPNFWRKQATKPGIAGVGGDRGGAAKAADARAEKLAKVQANTAKLQTTAAKAQSLAAKEQLLLTRAGSILDVAQAEIYAALQNKITDNERLRLDLQLALLTNNSKAADQLSQELLVSQLQTTNLAQTLVNLPKALNPFSEWPKYIQDLIAQIGSLQNAYQAAKTQTQIATAPSQNPIYNGTASAYIGAQGGYDAAGNYVGTPFGQAGSMGVGHYDTAGTYVGTPFGQAGTTINNVSVDASNVVDSAQMVRIIQQALIDINKGGYSQTPAGYGF